jgi:hypothetical protein
VTRHASVLVVGFQDARKASDLHATDQLIELMPEEDFFQQLALSSRSSAVPA